MDPVDLSKPLAQAKFGAMIGVEQSRVSQLLTAEVLTRGATVGVWLHEYCEHMRVQAAGRASEGDLDLTQERAALAREQRVSYEIKNAISRGEYAPIGLLADVLARAAVAVSDRFDTVPGLLKKTCPDLPTSARDAVVGVLTSARNAWEKATRELVIRDLDEELAEVEP